MQTVKFVQLVDERSGVTAEEFVAQARKYVGARFMLQGTEPGFLDCGQLVLLTARELKITDLEVLGYSVSPDPDVLEDLLGRLFARVPKESVSHGDVVGCDYGKGIEHTAIVTSTEPRLKVVHAKRQHGVCEQYLHGIDLRAWTRCYRLRHLV